MKDMLKGQVAIVTGAASGMGEADVAGVALFFASELSSYVTGLCMYVAGGSGYVYSHDQSFILGALTNK